MIQFALFKILDDNIIINYNDNGDDDDSNGDNDSGADANYDDEITENRDSMRKLM